MHPADHADAATSFLRDAERTGWHDQALWFVRQKRDLAAHAVPEWEALRDLASTIKRHTASHLALYLQGFERSARQNGVVVHWARDAAEHNGIVLAILRERGAQRLVKSKSMLTEECGLNPFLTQRGIDVVETDLGERIVQLAGEEPSHIVMPAIHWMKEEVAALFHRALGTREDPDPAYLAEAARQHLRGALVTADAALTGVNFAVAETGAMVVCTNEGNADLGAHLAPLHIACMGLDKVIPRTEHLGVFLRLLARSATGQPVTAYTSHYVTPRPGTELHVVIVDNGRTEQLGRPDFRESLHCIRCGACLNTCPVYRRSGGHSYGVTVAGPIGAVLAPGFDLAAHASLPFASTLCGSCADVCPVKIDLPRQLYRWRQVVVASGQVSWRKRVGMRLLGATLARVSRYERAGRLVRRLLRRAPGLLDRPGLNPWSRSRELPPAPVESFREWYRRERGSR
ncbi:MAG: lactate utilization protein [Gemmatimonadales bacterium]|nr:lactate utilization protein [Gemmatimonadales bacterium]